MAIGLEQGLPGCYTRSMKQLLSILAVLGALLFSAGESFALPVCKGNFGSWNNFEGTYTSASGDKYVGEYKDGKRNGHFTVTYADGNKDQEITAGDLHKYVLAKVFRLQRNQTPELMGDVTTRVLQFTDD